MTQNTGAKSRTGTLTIAGKTFNVTQAGVPPTISGQSPASGATAVSRDTTVSVTFSETMNASSITTSSFTLTQGSSPVSGSVSYDAGTQTATFTPSGNLAYSTSYTATLTTGVQDNEGVALASSSSWSFTTVGYAARQRQQRRRRGRRVLHRHGGLRLGARAAGGHAEGVPRRLSRCPPTRAGPLWSSTTPCRLPWPMSSPPTRG